MKSLSERQVPWERKDLFGLCVCVKAGQELKQETEAEAMGHGVCGLFTQAHAQLSHRAQGMVPPTVAQVLPHQSAIKTLQTKSIQLLD